MSVAPAELLESGLAKIDDDLAFLMDCLREVLVSLGEEHLARFVPWTAARLNERHVPASEEPAASEPFPARLGQVYATAFQLLNLIEENVSGQVRRTREKIAGPASEPGLWGANLQKLRAAGLGAEEIAAGLSGIIVEPVLTAHPTEAKRATTLEQHRRLFHLLQDREDPRHTPLELADLREEIKVTLERLWRTGEILLRKPEVAAERRNLMYYFREVFPRALPDLDRRLQQAWAEAGFDPALLGHERVLPRLKFGTWVGGDRDGHPLVTAETTRETLDELRAGGLQVVSRHLLHLANRLCLSHHVQKPPASFSSRLGRLMEEAGERGQRILHDAPEEPWKQYVRLLLLKLPLTDAGPRAGHVYQRPAELSADIEHLRASLAQIGAQRIADRDVQPVLRAVEAFGFHLATLDVRQNSAFHDRALGQLLKLAGDAGDDFARWSEEQRLDFGGKGTRLPPAVRVCRGFRRAGGRRGAFLLPPAGGEPPGERSRRPRGAHRQHDPPAQRPARGVPAGPGSRAGGQHAGRAGLSVAVGHAAVRDRRGPGTGSRHHARLPVPSRDQAQPPGNRGGRRGEGTGAAGDDRLQRQQQGKRYPGEPMGAAPRADGADGRWDRSRGSASGFSTGAAGRSAGGRGRRIVSSTLCRPAP